MCGQVGSFRVQSGIAILAKGILKKVGAQQAIDWRSKVADLNSSKEFK